MDIDAELCDYSPLCTLLGMSTFIPTKSVLADLGALVSEQISPAAISGERWPALVDLSLKQGLGPMLAWVLKKNQFSLPDHSLDERLQQVTRGWIMRWLLLQEAQQRLQSAFAGAAVTTIWLKGIVLANNIYPNPWLRPMVDLDVLVPHEQCRRALATARQMGFHQANTSELLMAPDLIHHYVLTGPAFGGLMVPESTFGSVTVELHSRLLGVGGRDSLLPAERLEWFVQPEQLIQTTQGFTTLKPEAHLLYLCAHALLQHSEHPLYLLRFLDLHLLISHRELDWDLVIVRASTLRWSLAVERALVLANQYFSTPMPDHVIPALRLSSRMAGARPMHKVNTSSTEWDSTKRWLGQLRLREHAQAIRRVILPSRSYMRRHYGLRQDQSVWRHYPVRWWSQGRRIAQSLIRSLRRRGA